MKFLFANSSFIFLLLKKEINNTYLRRLFRIRHFENIGLVIKN